MFFGDTFRQLPIGLLIMASVFAVVSQIIRYTSTGSWSSVEVLITFSVFVVLALIALTHSLRIKSDGSVVSSLLGVLKKAVKSEDSLEVDLKPTFWSNYSRTLILTSNGKKIYSINIHDLGFDPNSNAKELLNRLTASRDNLKLSDTAKSFVSGNVDISGKKII